MKDKKLFISIVSIFTIISFLIGVSYAYFTVQLIGNDTASAQNIKTGTLKINYTGTDTLDMNNIEPPDTKSTTFTVTNSGTLPVNNYQVYFSKVINQILNDEMVYTLTCTSSDTNPCLGKEETPLPKNTGSALTQSSIAPGTTHTYTLSVTFKDTGSLQDYNQNKQVSFKITINEQQEFGALVARQGWNSTELFWSQAGNITEITFENAINIPNGVTSWDVSVNQNKSAMAYIIDDGLGTNTYHLHIQSDEMVYANSNMSNWFRNLSKLKKINNLNLLNTSNVTNMVAMFNGCSGLTSLDLSTFTTSNVTNMSQMFYGCSGLTSLDLSTFTTSNVTNMVAMFNGCSGLTSLDLSTFTTSNVTNMSYMFNGCSGLTSLDLSTFTTANVTNMYYMFSGCSGLTSLDLSAFNTNNVTTMYGMFYGCSGLTSLNLSSFNTGNVTNMYEMFSGCSGLSNLNLRNMDFTTVTSYVDMFYNITSGINIIVKDSASQTFINIRLSNAGRTGNVTIYVP